MKNRLFKLLSLSLILGVIGLTTNCKKDFDEPPFHQIPIGEVVSIGDLRQIFADSGQYTFKTDYSVYATVTMGEASGNIYKSAYIQDTSGAINLHLNASGGVNAGDLIRVYLKGCMLNSYGELLQIDNVDNDSNIIIQANDQYMMPTVLSIPDLASGKYESYLIKLNDVQFAESDSGKTYADMNTNDYGNRMLEDCNGNTVIVRTSSYASFASDILPRGKGDLIAIAGKFNDDWQLYIRTIAEVNLTGPRCGGGGGDLTQISIADLRAMFTGSASNIPADLMIQGVITSDKDNENLTGNNAFIQETNGAAIVLRFDDWHDLPLGELVEVNVSGLELSEFKGMLQVNNIPLSRAKMLGQGTLPTPIELTIANLLLDFENYEAMLVKFSDVQISSSGGYSTYKYALNLNDGTGDIEMFTQEYASFANEDFPTDEVDITALVSQYDDPQVLIRNTDDVVTTGGGGGGGGTVDAIDEDFQGQTAYADISIPDWLNVAVTGSRKWIAKEFEQNTYAQATSYNSTEANETWLITVGINLDNIANPALEFESAQAYWTHDGLTVWISTDFDGSNIQGATWQPISCTLAGSNNSDYEFVPSGQISLSAYSGVGYIAFKYIGDDNSGLTCSYIIDNVKVFDAK